MGCTPSLPKFLSKKTKDIAEKNDVVDITCKRKLAMYTAPMYLFTEQGKEQSLKHLKQELRNKQATKARTIKGQ